ncbi:MAG: Nif11-like leader peptide family natural product precursor [Atopobiaceae bacterium]|nr:Nif11-like leader peptide family natural product precursor [Atopobiaceae bacterium]
MNLDDISPELRAKAKECKSTEELLELARQEGYELSDEALENVSGGWGDDSDCDGYCFLDCSID